MRHRGQCKSGTEALPNSPFFGWLINPCGGHVEAERRQVTVLLPTWWVSRSSCREVINIRYRGRTPPCWRETFWRSHRAAYRDEDGRHPTLARHNTWLDHGLAEPRPEGFGGPDHSPPAPSSLKGGFRTGHAVEQLPASSDRDGSSFIDNIVTHSVACRGWSRCGLPCPYQKPKEADVTVRIG
jgi:hypothetical protein